ncbi:hypothetical protein R1sor_015334 [Riccia sorocarpa]|uniref:SCAN box domain-containing protein n=1 Tax=Riccia sorocarpa TaxID=122646 RepID=A0ABD3HBY6_9MARC
MLSGHYYPGLRWLFCLTVSRIRAETLWRLATQPESTKPVDVDEGREPPEDCGSQYDGERQPPDPPTARTDRQQKHSADSGHDKEDCPEFISLFRELMQEWMIPDAVGDMDDLDALK